MKCPLCNSSGDDLVFRFYCSNPLCKNFIPKCDPEADTKVTSRVDRSFNLFGNVPLDIIGPYKLIPIELMKARGEPCLNSSEFLNAPFMEKVIPEFAIVEALDPHKWRFTWRDKVPQMLAILVASYLEKYIGERMCDSTYDAISDDISVYLHHLKSCGNLVWNDWCKKWELHFTD